MTKHDATQWSSKKAQRKGSVGGHAIQKLIARRKEQLVQNQCRSRSVDKKIVPFDGGAHKARQHHAANITGAGCGWSGSNVCRGVWRFAVGHGTCC